MLPFFIANAEEAIEGNKRQTIFQQNASLDIQGRKTHSPSDPFLCSGSYCSSYLSFTLEFYLKGLFGWVSLVLFFLLVWSALCHLLLFQYKAYYVTCISSAPKQRKRRGYIESFLILVSKAVNIYLRQKVNVPEAGD